MKRKGQLISMLAVFTLLFISGGSLFTAVLGQQQIKHTVSYSSNDVNQLAHAEVKSEIYRKNIRKELNYSFNNVANAIAEEGGKVEWSQNIPSETDIEDALKGALLDHEYDIKSQNRLMGCQPPAINEDVLSVESDHSLELDFTDAAISCSGLATRAIVPIDERLRITNNRNNYLEIGADAIKLAEEVKRLIQEKDWTNEGSQKSELDYTTCRALGEGGDKTDEARSDAKESASDPIKSRNLAQEAYNNLESNGELHDYLEDRLTSTTVTGTYTRIGEEASGTCEYTKCVEYESCGPSNEQTCCANRETFETSYSIFKYRFEADAVQTRFRISDSQNTITTLHGDDSRLVFDFTYENRADVG
ncbi:MAG: hypothetical protein ABEI58_04115 [Candidatus Nanohaloarchaea archaeon]